MAAAKKKTATSRSAAKKTAGRPKPAGRAAPKKAAGKKPAARKAVKKAAKAPARKPAAKKTPAKQSKAATSKPGISKPAGDASNRRRFDRRDTRIKASLIHANGTVAGTVTNLSLQGCLFEPQVPLPIGSRVKLHLAGETPVSATVKGVSGLGVHCLLHAGGVTLGRLTADLDDMAILMLNAGRPHTPDSVSKKRRG